MALTDAATIRSGWWEMQVKSDSNEWVAKDTVADETVRAEMAEWGYDSDRSSTTGVAIHGTVRYLWVEDND